MVAQPKQDFSGSFKDAMAAARRRNPQDIFARMDAEAARLNIVLESPKAYQCDTCHDMGVICSDVTDNNDPRFGKLFLCPNPTCPARNANLQAKYQKLIEKSKIPTKYINFSFASWKEAATHRSGQDNWFLDFVENWVTAPGHWLTMPGRWLGGADVTRNSLIFSGDYGVGKTGLMIAVANALMAQGEQPLYIRAMDYIDMKYVTYANTVTETDREAIQLIQSAPILCLDDFNVANGTANKQDVIEDLLRYRHGHELPTLLTTNLAPDGLAHLWGKRAVDALMEAAHWIPVGGAPLRDTRQIGGVR